MKKAETFFVDFVYNQGALSEKEKVFITTKGIKIVNFVKDLSKGIISFLVLRYIFLKMYFNSGFEETIITLVILMIIIIKFSFGGDKK